MQNNKILTFSILFVGFIFFIGCETGLENKKRDITAKEELHSGIIANSELKGESVSYTKKGTVVSTKVGVKKIFSVAAVPGFYLQVGYFKDYKPNQSFMTQLNRVKLDYIILERYKNYYALIGPYKSFNQAHARMNSVKSFMKINSFVVQVLRP
jgi:hypothetical protein